MKLGDLGTVTVSYYHVFSKTVRGRWQSPAGAIPNTKVKSRVSEDSVSISLNVPF